MKSRIVNGSFSSYTKLKYISLAISILIQIGFQTIQFYRNQKCDMNYKSVEKNHSDKENFMEK